MTAVAAAAVPDSVTVQVAAPPEDNVVGEHARADRIAAGAEIVTAAVTEAPFNFAVTVAD